MTIKAEKGSRKLQNAREASIFLLLGLLIAAWVKLDFQLYLCFATGVCGVSGFFMHNNSKEHAADAPKTPAAA